MFLISLFYNIFPQNMYIFISDDLSLPLGWEKAFCGYIKNNIAKPVIDLYQTVAC